MGRNTMLWLIWFKAIFFNYRCAAFWRPHFFFFLFQQKDLRGNLFYKHSLDTVFDGAEIDWGCFFPPNKSKVINTIMAPVWGFPFFHFSVGASRGFLGYCMCVLGVLLWDLSFEIRNESCLTLDSFSLQSLTLLHFFFNNLKGLWSPAKLLSCEIFPDLKTT